MSEPHLIQSLPQTIDPLALCQRGRYDDYLVRVRRADHGQTEDPGPVVRTDHFCLWETGHRSKVSHWLRPDQLGNDGARRQAEELLAPGWLSGVEILERVFTGVGRSVVAEPHPAWCTL